MIEIETRVSLKKKVLKEHLEQESWYLHSAPWPPSTCFPSTWSISMGYGPYGIPIQLYNKMQDMPPVRVNPCNIWHSKLNIKREKAVMARQVRKKNKASPRRKELFLKGKRKYTTNGWFANPLAAHVQNNPLSWYTPMYAINIIHGMNLDISPVLFGWRPSLPRHIGMWTSDF